MLLVCYVLLYVVTLCVKMRYVILSIKRLLIELTSQNLRSRHDRRFVGITSHNV